ncbi:hypothetical protein LRR18_16535, partial [Mangrovimonas sp. AS39]|uniref:hypothetical protein n=1 Tax=Mangrovimonas futianensis TaxID=2895523 RepID=UPI001E65D155
MSPSDSFLAKKTYTWVLSIGGEVVGKIQNKTIYPWDQPGFIKHGVSPSELMFQIEADELYDHYKNYHDVYYLLAKKYPDSSIAQARINYYANQATLAKFVGPPDKPSAKIPGATYMWNEPSVVQTPADKSYMNPKPQYYEAYVIKGTKNKIYWSYDSSRTWNGTGFD